MKVTALTQTIYYCTWNGKRQPCKVDRPTVLAYIERVLNMGERATTFKVFSTYGELDLALFLNGVDKTV